MQSNTVNAIVIVAFYHLHDGVLTAAAAAAGYSRLSLRRLNA
jgi:hypothetical protein